jgi:hypothetical protein
VQFDDSVLVGVDGGEDLAPDPGVDAQLLAKFTGQTACEGFPWLALAAGKLPVASEMHTGPAFRDE